MIPYLFAQSDQIWYSLPLVVSISLVYAATRHEDMPSILRHALHFGAWIMFFMVALGLLIWWMGRGL
jgi:hypothetical protein